MKYANLEQLVEASKKAKPQDRFGFPGAQSLGEQIEQQLAGIKHAHQGMVHYLGAS